MIIRPFFTMRHLLGTTQMPLSMTTSRIRWHALETVPLRNSIISIVSRSSRRPNWAASSKLTPSARTGNENHQRFQKLGACWLMLLLIGMLLSNPFASNAFAQPSDSLPPSAEQRIEFAIDVRPLLEKHCWSCHGSSEQESGLRLDSLTATMHGGDLGKVVVQGKGSESRLIHYIAALDPDHIMPPEGDRLSPKEIGILRAWIDQGCQWPESESAHATKNLHWAYQPIRTVEPPLVTNTAWPINQIDRFVLAGLEKKEWEPSKEANRPTLIRRLYLDLLGLLPPDSEVASFVHDKRSESYEQLVDRLLESQHFGERWGRHWLDMARYADSDGYEKDNARPDAYRWREWVIDAINSDMPFDQFTIEQLAGDLLPNPTPMQRLATAFHRQTLTNTEGGTDKEQFRVEACFDRTETTGAVWLGLTVGCARCHSHKYDAISQREYYQLFAVFNNGDEESVVVPKSPPEVEAYGPIRAAYELQLAELTERLRVEQEKRKLALNDWITETKKQVADAKLDALQLYSLKDAQVTADSDIGFQGQEDDSFLVVGNDPERAIYTLQAKCTANKFGALRIDALPDASLPAEGPGRVAHGNFVLSEVTAEIAFNENFTDAKKLVFTKAKADFEQAKRPWAASDVLDGKEDTGWAIGPEYGKPHWLVLQLDKPFEHDGDCFVRVQLSQQHGKQHTLGRFKVSLQSGDEPKLSLPENIAKIFAKASKNVNEADQKLLLEHFTSFDPLTKSLAAELSKLKKNEPPTVDLKVRVIAQRTKDARKTFVLKRGEFLDPIEELEMLPSGLSTLPPFTSRHEGSIADRLDLARWLVASNNPLVPRVTVNHIWRQLFGNGLVRTPNDFGVRGETPTHPELLDWLAANFIGLEGTTKSTAWSRKALIKLIVMSATYRQSSMFRSELRELDPHNFGLARQNRLRVEGEIVRDISLDAAGLLSRKLGGPSVYPPLPPGIAELSYAGNFKWPESKGEDRYRRGMYTFFKRTSPHPNLTTFDCPDANLTCVTRQVSNTPLQALASLNNETFAEAARAFARRLLAAPSDSDEERIKSAFRICVARPATEREISELMNLLNESRAWYENHSVEAKQLMGASDSENERVFHQAAWTSTARVLLNLDEFLTRE